MGSRTEAGFAVIVLDTNVLSELGKRECNANVSNWTEQQDPGDLWITSTTISELNLGVARMPEGKRRDTLGDVNARFVAAFYDRTFSFDSHAAGVYGRLVADRMSGGRPISREDAQIAASCIATGAALATHNTRDFDAIPELELIDPWEAN